MIFKKQCKCFAVMGAVLLFAFFTPLIAQNTNILVNGGLETMEPGFWNKVNDGLDGALVTWANDTSSSWYRSFKIEKTAVASDMVGWTSVNNADLYWNNAAADVLYNLEFMAKSAGVNTSPANDDAKIGVMYKFYGGGALLGEQFVEIDQSVADKQWTKYTAGLLIPAGTEPDEVTATAYMGKDATGTVWFDDVNASSDPWSMGMFNADAETPVGWLYWTAGPDNGVFNIDNTVANSGTYSVSLEDFDDDSDELVFYTTPVTAKPNTYYKVSAWVKWDSINTDASFLPSNVTGVRDDERIGFTFFFHKGQIDRGWDLATGDLFYYIDQRDSSGEWTQYSVIYKSPEEASGVSVRARFTSFPKGRVWFDDFMVEELEFGDEILVNGGLETMEPGFWNKVNDGLDGALVTWANDTSSSWYRSFKIEKTAVASDMVGWTSVNNADLYWNNAAADVLYNLEFMAKSAGVNTSPANDDAKIGVMYKFYGGGALLGEQFVEIDQSVADKQWTKYTAGLLIPAGTEPDEVTATAYMGKDATGTVWFDDVNASSDPWSMGMFNADAETPVGWLYWTAGPDNGVFNIDNTVANSGTYSVSLEDFDDDSDELVFYTTPVTAKPNTYYKVSAWVKWDSINTDASFLPSNVTGVRDDERIGFTFFFHKGQIDRGWDLATGDLFYYIDQRDSSGEWTQYSVIYKSPEEASGVSVRARFTSFPKGRVWFDDFSVQKFEGVVVSVEENPSDNIALRPQDFKLLQNYPNPFNPSTIIEYKVPEAGAVSIEIFNALGQKVKTVVDAFHQQGTYSAHWAGTNTAGAHVTTGIYFYRLKANGAFITRKMILAK
ncbi:MAG: T9SS C-terminal target domain-containing protein [Calditrichaeota bacterium]|nr:MAG: T9SS C-terminal target domain-containing protein [Calditrichota bacterium]